MTAGLQVVASRPCRVCSAPVFPEQRFCGECGAGVALGLGDEDADADAGVADPLVGRIVADRYRMVRCIGRGGMGVVYEVEHVHIGKRLAMKLLHGELAGDSSTIRRLRREAEAVSRLSDSSTVQVFDFGTSDGLAYLVMELVEGDDLGQVLRLEGTVPFGRIARLVLDACASLAEAHALGIVHRDLKPENIMVLRGSLGERAKVLDFGLAMLRASAHQSISRTGSIVGTPHYMAPEQIRAEEVDARADIYALGGVLYRGVVGAPPFTGDSAIVVLTKHLNEAVVPPSARVDDVDARADAIILRCLAKSPKDRYASVVDLAHDLESWLSDRGLLDGPTRRDVTTAHRVEAIATRRDVDAYEDRLKRRSRATTVAMVAVFVGIAAALAYATVRTVAPSDAPTRELEPNDGPEQATRLARGQELVAKLGRRIDASHGDIDVYRLVRSEGDPPIQIRASVTALPNVDLTLELFREGTDEPLLRVDGGGVGSGEAVVGFPIATGAYLLVVREHAIPGTYPIENISDSYRIRWEPVEGADGEIDDSIATARALVPGTVVRGRIGWDGDEDVVCAEGGARGRITVTPGPTLDVSLATAGDRGAPQTNATGEGGAEVIVLGGGSETACARIFRSPGPGVPAGVLNTGAGTAADDASYGVLFVTIP